MPYGDRKRPRELMPTAPFLFLQHRGTQLTWSTNTFMVWNTESVNTSDFLYKTGESKIFILTPGFYKINYNMSLYLYSGALSHTDMRLYRNGTILPGSMSSSSFPDNYPITLAAFYYVYLDNGDYIQMESVVGTGGGTISTVTGTVRLSIELMSMLGWNNGRGGSDETWQ